MVDNIDKDLWLSDYRNNIITFKSKTYALNAINIMADAEYIYPDSQLHNMEIPNDTIEVSTLKELGFMISEELSKPLTEDDLKDLSPVEDTFTDILEDLTRLNMEI